MGQARGGLRGQGPGEERAQLSSELSSWRWTQQPRGWCGTGLPTPTAHTSSLPFPLWPRKNLPSPPDPPSVASLLLSARPSAPVPSGPSSDATSPRKTPLIKAAQLPRPHLSAPNTQPWHLSLHCPGHSSGLVAQLLPFPHLSFSFSWEGQAHGRSLAAGCWTQV